MHAECWSGILNARDRLKDLDLDERIILSSVRVTIDGVWIGNWIYCTLIQLVNYTSQIIIMHTRPSQSVTVASRCLVAASNGGRFHSSRFPNCPRPRLPTSSSNS
jgi:hypothetical protein